MKLILLTVLSAVIACGSAITTNQITTLKRTISQNVLAGGNIPLSVRLAFHDCVGPKGCDGCVNMDLADNNGLAGIYATVGTVYNTILTADERNLLTFADFIALCGVRAVEVSSRDDYQGSVEFSFKTGRPTTASCNTAQDNYNVGQFPSALSGFDGTMTDFMQPQFGLTVREAVVLLGAHSLGGANSTNSGFSGPWTDQPNKLNNAYYVELQNAVKDHWQQVQPKKNAVNHPQWENVGTKKRSERRLIEILANLLSESERKKRQTTTPKLMMFNSDMCLYKQLEISGTVGESACKTDVASCADATTTSIVDTLAENNTVFMDEFIPVFTKMIEKVEAGVTLVDATVSASKKDLKKRVLVELLEGLLEVIDENDV